MCPEYGLPSAFEPHHPPGWDSAGVSTHLFVDGVGGSIPLLGGTFQFCQMMPNLSDFCGMLTRFFFFFSLLNWVVRRNTLLRPPRVGEGVPPFYWLFGGDTRLIKISIPILLLELLERVWVFFCPPNKSFPIPSFSKVNSHATLEVFGWNDTLKLAQDPAGVNKKLDA